MAVGNRLAKQEQKQNGGDRVAFMANGVEVKISMNDVKNYLVSGDKDRVTVKEVVMFMNLCRFAGLNPWLKEAYIIKYGNEPATLVTGKEAFLRRAEANPEYDGMESGVIVQVENAIEYRTGTLVLKGEELIGGWAEVWRRGRSHSCRIEVSFEEYAGRKKDGTLNSQWIKKPATMIRKVAQVQALRETFPSMLGAMYIAEDAGDNLESVMLDQMLPDKAPQDFQKEEPAAEPQIEAKEAAPAPQAAPQDDVAAALFGPQ